MKLSTIRQKCYWLARLLPRAATKRWRLTKVRKACRPYIALASLIALVGLLYLFVVNSASSPILSLKPSLQQQDTKLRCFDAQKDEHFQDVDKDPMENIKFYLDDLDMSAAYLNKWVGFQGMERVNCPMALSVRTVNRVYPQHVNRTFTQDIYEDAQNCSFFVQKYGFSRYPRPVRLEEDFPIAYIVLFHKDLDQFLFLLRAIYRPHNAYCLAIDTKSPLRFHAATRALVRCLPNVFVSSKLMDVIYGGMSRLMVDINCFKDLMKHPVKWKYIINTPGQQFPLRTNLEMVQILTLFAGTNDILGKHVVEEKWKYKYVHVLVNNETSGKTDVKITKIRHSPLPIGLKAVKSSAYGAFSRQFVNFTLESQLAKDVLEWSKDIYSPDEMYWGILNYNHAEPAPGGFLGNVSENPWLSSYSEWAFAKGSMKRCLSKFVRGVCIFSPADLPMLVRKPNFFANKFHITHQPAALHCLDQWIFNKTFSLNIIDEKMYLAYLKKRFYVKSSYSEAFKLPV